MLSTLPTHVTTLADGDLVGLTTGLINDGTKLLLSVAAAMAIFFVLRNVIESFTFTRILISLAVAALMWWGVNHLQDLSTATDKTVKSHNSSMVHLVPDNQHNNTTITLAGPPYGI